MTTRNIKSSLWITSLLLFVSATAIAAWAFSTTPTVTTSNKSPHVSTSGNTDQADIHMPTLDQFKSSWALRLQRPLYNPPPAPKPTVVVRPKPKPTARLIGTIVTAGQSTAMIVIPSKGGRVQLIDAGNKFQDAAGEAEFG